MSKKCEKGFTLLEVVYSIVVLSLFTSTFFPILTMVYDERTTIREQQMSLDVLQGSIHEWLYDDVIPPPFEEIKQNGTVYSLTHLATDTGLTSCIRWNGRNDREYERCEQAKK